MNNLRIPINGPAVLWLGNPIIDPAAMQVVPSMPPGFSSGGNTLENVQVPEPGQLVCLGIAEAGVDVVINKYVDSIPISTGGPHIPADGQDMGMDAVIRFRLTAKNDTAIYEMEKSASNTNVLNGQIGVIGMPMLLNGKGFRLVIQSETDLPYRFLTAYMRGPRRSHRSTRPEFPDMEVYAFPFIGVKTSAKGTPLYDRIAA